MGLTVGRLLGLAVADGDTDTVGRSPVLHQRIAARLACLLDRQSPDEQAAVHGVEMLVSAAPLTVRVPDVLVVPAAVIQDNLARFDAADILLAIEVLSEGTERTDRVTKLFEYAEAGIEHYWIVDPGPPVRLITYRLVDGDYRIWAGPSHRTSKSGVSGWRAATTSSSSSCRLLRRG
ncbi:Uma2 family endonuclease [Amycolatopsis saalfeldensis]|uniref:Putative restriction endonuclease n=1 Tax=Amycolatopsis saalfeldensis TaxID=394193 RepID=A0A1H8YBI2_9PSEU|nr:Uma2 family endonuclease [Amycolatopsis saalfeldensis]SEP49515.1 Putative restriction endonuclease [Amycolatopsis saalfeldensis]